MAKTTRSWGSFVPPEKERQLRELEGLEAEQQGRVRRRMMFRWMGWGAVMVLLAQWSIGFVSFFTPKRLGAFGGTVVAGNITDFKVGDVKQVRDGKFYMTRVPEGLHGPVLEVPAPGLHGAVGARPTRPCPARPMAATWRITDKGRFKCPCHGSIYNRYGQIIQGPAPRPMDHFPITIDATGHVTVETGPIKAISRTVANARRRRPAPILGRRERMDYQHPRADYCCFSALVLGAVLWYAARVAVPLPEGPAGTADRRPGHGAQDHRHRGHDRGYGAAVSGLRLPRTGSPGQSPGSATGHVDRSRHRHLHLAVLPLPRRKGPGRRRAGSPIRCGSRRRSTERTSDRRTPTRAPRSTTSSSRPSSAVAPVRRCRPGARSTAARCSTSRSTS